MERRDLLSAELTRSRASAIDHLTRADIIDRVSDIGFVRSPQDEMVTQGLRQAAVLVPIVLRPDGLTVLLTKRTDHLTDHAGQISFPGGRIEPEDETPEHAALRETLEEISLTPDHIEVIGRLAPVVTGTGFCIVPVLGLIEPPFTVTPDPFEVAEIFEVPLAFILDPLNHERRPRDPGAARHFYVLPYEDRNIWGATAAILVDLATILNRV
jgi:8-oxo-dGTP pyrophosphatase MutT (NUDIX family)